MPWINKRLSDQNGTAQVSGLNKTVRLSGQKPCAFYPVKVHRIPRGVGSRHTLSHEERLFQLYQGTSSNIYRRHIDPEAYERVELM